jgi:hypothetical protein
MVFSRMRFFVKITPALQNNSISAGERRIFEACIHKVNPGAEKIRQACS